MATNMIYKDGDQLKFYTNAALNSGDPFVVGQIPAVAMGDEDTDGYVVGRMVGVFDLSVSAVSTDITPGTAIYYHAGALNNTAADGVLFGYALEGLTVADSPAVIKVLLARS